MIADGASNWHYLAVKSISGLLRGTTSNHNGDFFLFKLPPFVHNRKKLEA